jgi:hypothetical protein
LHQQGLILMRGILLLDFLRHDLPDEMSVNFTL